MTTFTVDTHLFRELGELLVGRDSTALVELVKNAYDADATKVVVFGSGLSDQEAGFIRIADNGTGMNRRDFQDGFLRIASRVKETSERRSARFVRRYTGAKGIGRLAAHKLARCIEVDSRPWSGNGDGVGVHAVIDWDLVEQCETLEQVEGTSAIVVEDLPHTQEEKPGTTITLTRLRRRWTDKAHGEFLGEVQTFQVPPWLTAQLPETVLKEQLLFDKPTLRDIAKPEGIPFDVKLEGDLALPDDFWTVLLSSVNWVIEIDADGTTKKVSYAIAPTERTRQEVPDAERALYTIDHPTPDDGPFFQSRILIRTGPLRQSASIRSWVGRSSGVRVFMEGFRVLPYGEPRNDWLALDRDVTERGRGVITRPDSDPLSRALAGDESEEEVGLLHLPNKHYFGAVFLTEGHARALRLLVNREGFIPGPAYDTLVSLVRNGIDLATRVRATATAAARAQRKARRSLKSGPATSTDQMPTAAAVRTAVNEARALAEEAKRLMLKGEARAAGLKLDGALDLFARVADVSDTLAREEAMLRVLASVGTQLASFVHEVNSLLGMAQALENSVTRLRKSVRLKPGERQILAEFARATGDLRRNLERQASYLVDVVTPDARRRRMRQSLSDRFDSGARIVASAADRRGIAVQNGIPGELRSPPMFPAELTTVFANLLTNAVKAAGPNGRIRGTGTKRRDGSVVIQVQNTGARVSLTQGERWFRPFESSTTKVDPVLGQGMGLGLPITRSILDEYGATIRFVEPTEAYATAVEITFPE